MTLCILDAWDPSDAALVNSHWVARRSVDALEKAKPGTTVVIEGSAVDRLRVDQELDRPHDGFVFCGDGRDDALVGVSPDPENRPVVIDLANLGAVGSRWFHAFACLAGNCLCMTAAREGAAAFLGYNEKLVVEWDTHRLPSALADLLAELVTTATLELARGVRSRGTVRKAVRRASNRLLGWQTQNSLRWNGLPPNVQMGLSRLATLLHKGLEMEGTQVVE